MISFDGIEQAGFHFDTVSTLNCLDYFFHFRLNCDIVLLQADFSVNEKFSIGKISNESHVLRLRAYPAIVIDEKWKTQR